MDGLSNTAEIQGPHAGRFLLAKSLGLQPGVYPWPHIAPDLKSQPIIKTPLYTLIPSRTHSTLHAHRDIMATLNNLISTEPHANILLYFVIFGSMPSVSCHCFLGSRGYMSLSKTDGLSFACLHCFTRTIGRHVQHQMLRARGWEQSTDRQTF